MAEGVWIYCKNELNSKSICEEVSTYDAETLAVLNRSRQLLNKRMNFVGTGESTHAHNVGESQTHIMARAQRDPHHCRH
jgi:hypothetical protein